MMETLTLVRRALSFPVTETL
ncbi:hypothetical protein EMIT0P253_390034 [Pseudomonas sp. IT-P253]